MLADKFDYYATEYDPAKIAEGKKPREFADFQNLHFEDSKFDLVIASDVFEHIRDDMKGYREIHRVLKPGGSLLLTVPYDHNRPATIVRVDTRGEKDLHLLEPEYHGGGGHTLTYRNYGRDLLSLLHNTGYAVCHQAMDIPAYGITPQSVILARKGEFTEVADRSGTVDQLGSLGVLVPHRLFLLYKYTIRGFVHYWHEMKRK